jgi:hypothetical protein
MSLKFKEMGDENIRLNDPYDEFMGKWQSSNEVIS